MQRFFLSTLLFFVSIIYCHAKSLGRIGNQLDTTTNCSSGFLLMGGSTDVDEAVKWFLAKSGGGDIVIIRASGGAGYNEYMYKLGKVNSVETLLINSKEEALDPSTAAIIQNAEAVFIAGGDQWNYINFWSNTPVQEALNYLIKIKHAPIGGTSAGLAVMGQYVFDAKMDGITTDEALANMQSPKISISKEFISTSILKNIITDSHYTQRNRMGRHIAFLANIQSAFNIKPKGIGIDEKTALVIDEKGRGFIFGISNIYFLQIISNKKLAPTSPTVSVVKITGSKEGTPIASLKNCFKALTYKVKIENKSLITF